MIARDHRLSVLRNNVFIRSDGGSKSNVSEPWNLVLPEWLAGKNAVLFYWVPYIICGFFSQIQKLFKFSHKWNRNRAGQSYLTIITREAATDSIGYSTQTNFEVKFEFLFLYGSPDINQRTTVYQLFINTIKAVPNKGDLSWNYQYLDP